MLLLLLLMLLLQFLSPLLPVVAAAAASAKAVVDPAWAGQLQDHRHRPAFASTYTLHIIVYSTL